MKTLSFTQPWGTLVVSGAKRVETRSWSTPYRGWLLIHASKAFPREDQDLIWSEPFESAVKRALHVPLWSPRDVVKIVPRGAIIGAARLRGCYRIGPREFWPPAGSELDQLLTPTEREFGNYESGRWAWVLGNAWALSEPIPSRGALGLWDAPEDVLARLRAMGMPV